MDFAPRPTSPSPSVDFSIIDVDLDDPEVHFSTNTPIPGAYPITRRTMSGSRRSTFASSSSFSGWPAAAATSSTTTVESQNPFKGILPRIWDVISSPGRAVLSFSPSANLPAARPPSPPPRLGSWYLAEQPPPIPSRPSAKGKAKAFFSRNGSKSDLLYLPDVINYSDLAPLDGEEGELIDDEACFIDVRAITGIDLLALLPPEIALHILIMLCPLPSSPTPSHALSVDTEQNAARHAILACRAVSHTWRRLASDNALDWRLIYRERLELERRWVGTAAPARSINRPPRAPTDLLGLFDLAGNNEHEEDREMECKENIRPWEPVIRRMEGHTDSVYCVEFDSQYVVTGSRDRTIKVWSLKTGQALGTFQDAHRGSVLCLKFEKDWALGSGADVDAEPQTPKGLLVSGSSDCSICVWEMELGDFLPNGEREVRAQVRATLEGHEGGVLDIWMDEKWIVSCSKDASIRVWDRESLALSRVLRGHEGPVNAIGLQHDRVVSASGDGKLILWDVTNGERIRTFEGHDRGLACIEFKDNFIVSGSNDDKIKVWDPWTGECLRTLTGHSGLVRALSFDPRTGRLVSVSYDKTVKVWDFRTGKCVRDFGEVHGSHIFDVKFDAARIVTASHDHKIAEMDFSVGLDASLFI
ncbi:hypothetical protein MD484_g5453, partial [Candolleomyces efflorescens]